MSSKTIEKIIAKNQKELIGIETRSASEDNLPIIIEEDNALNLKEDSVVEIEEGPYKEISYLLMQAGKEEGYVREAEMNLDKLLKKHNFVKKDNYHVRVREMEIDYIFPRFLGYENKKGTFGIIINSAENGKFKESLKNASDRLGKNSTYDDLYGFLMLGGLTMGGIGGLVLAIALDFSVMAGIGTILFGAGSGMGSGAYGITSIMNKAEKRLNDAIQSQNIKIIESNRQYDFKVIKPFLNLTPEWILEKNKY